jgi:hypothetical protein
MDFEDPHVFNEGQSLDTLFWTRRSYLLYCCPSVVQLLQRSQLAQQAITSRSCTAFVAIESGKRLALAHKGEGETIAF